MSESQPNAPFKTVFDNPRLSSDDSLQIKKQLSEVLPPTLPQLKEALGSNQIAIFLYGSASIGIASEKDEKFFEKSDIDLLIIHNQKAEHQPTTISQLLNSYQNEQNDQARQAITNRMTNHTVHIREYCMEDIISTLDLFEKDTSDPRDKDFYIHLLSVILTCPNYGDADYIKECKEKLIDKIQGMGSLGENIWQRIKDKFYDEFLYYGTNRTPPDKKQLIRNTFKQSQRFNQVVPVILEREGIPPQKIPRATTLLKALRSGVKFPPLKDAKQVLL